MNELKQSLEELIVALENLHEALKELNCSLENLHYKLASDSPQYKYAWEFIE